MFDGLNMALVRRRSAYRSVFAPQSNMDPAQARVEGERVLADLCKRYHVGRPVVGRTSEETAFRDGQRSVVLDILHLLSVDPMVAAQKLYEMENDE